MQVCKEFQTKVVLSLRRVDFGGTTSEGEMMFFKAKVQKG